MIKSIGVILAGGQSSRMGCSKAYLPYAGTYLLDYMGQLLEALGLEEIYIAGLPPKQGNNPNNKNFSHKIKHPVIPDLDSNVARMQRQRNAGKIIADRKLTPHSAALHDGLHYLANSKQNTHMAAKFKNFKGPLLGIFSTLQHFDFAEQNYLFIPVDMPLLNIAILNNLLVNINKNPCHACYYDNYFLPLALKANESLKTYEPENNFSLKYFLKTIEAKSLSLASEEKKLFINTNTPAEWAALNA